MNTQILKFGKFKGKKLEDTPKWYQEWISKQVWFNKTESKPLHKQLVGWDGYSKKGEAIYDRIFEQEKNEMDEYENKMGFYYDAVNY